MYMSEDVAKFASDLKVSVRTWAENKIDELCATRPRMKAASIYMKRGLNNWLDREEERFDNMADTLAMFVADKDGKIDIDTLFDDAVKMFREMDVNYAKIANFAVEYGKGEVSIAIPRNVFLDMIFGDLGKVTITADDITELKSLMSVN